LKPAVFAVALSLIFTFAWDKGSCCCCAPNGGEPVTVSAANCCALDATACGSPARTVAAPVSGGPPSPLPCPADFSNATANGAPDAFVAFCPILQRQAQPPRVTPPNLPLLI